MRIVSPRITVRSLMTVVAIVAFALAIGMESGRWERVRDVCHHTAFRHDIDEHWKREQMKSYLKIAKDAERVVASLTENERLLQSLPRSKKPRPDDEWYVSRRAELAERNIRAAADARKGSASCKIRRLSRGLEAQVCACDEPAVVRN